MAKKTDKTETAVVVTTEHRGVFFGYTKDVTKRPLTLERMRMCIYWSADVKGVFGLCATGPNRTCKVGPAVPSSDLEKVTSVTTVTDEAAANWEKGFWG